MCVGVVQERAGETGLGRNEESEPGVGWGRVVEEAVVGEGAAEKMV